MAVTHKQQREMLPTRQVSLGPLRTTRNSKNIVSGLEIMQSVNQADLPGEISCVELVSVGIAPTATTDYATSVFNEVEIGSCCHVFLVTARTVSGYKQFHKTANAGAATDWKEVSYAP